MSSVYYPIRRVDGIIALQQDVVEVSGSTIDDLVIDKFLVLTPELEANLTTLKGKLYFDDLSNIPRYYDGTQWVDISTGGTFNGGTITNPFSVIDNTASVNVGTGAVVVTGGVGIGGDTSLTNLNTNGRITRKVRTTGVSTALDDDYMLNVSSAATITLPDITNSVYDGVTYIVIKATASTVVLDSGTDGIFQTGGVVNTISLTGPIGDRVELISNGINWYMN